MLMKLKLRKQKSEQSGDYPVPLSTYLSDDMRERLENAIPYGQRSGFVSRAIDLLLTLNENPIDEGRRYANVVCELADTMETVDAIKFCAHLAHFSAMMREHVRARFGEDVDED